MSKDITLRNGFRLAHGDFQRIKVALSDPAVFSSCVVRADLVRKALDPENYSIEGSNATFLREKGILDADSQMSVEMQNMISVIYGLDSDVELEPNACPYPTFDNIA